MAVPERFMNAVRADVQRCLGGLLLGLFALAVAGAARAAPPIIDYSYRFHPVVGEAGMVVSQEALASAVGARILERGGNAVDAAVATGFALAVTLPQAGNLGGGGFMLVHLAQSDKTVAIDYRELAPAGAHRDLFVGADGQVDTELARFSHRAAGVPGTVAGLLHAQERYGTLPLAEVLAPAIALAEEGILVTRALAFSLAEAKPRLTKSSAAAGYFLLPDGSAPPVGQRWRQKDLAKTLRQIAEGGRAAFYEGEIASKIVAEMAAHDGLITAADLAGYRVVEREPVRGSYRGYQIATMPPPSSGGVHLVQMLNILEGWDLAAQGHNSAAYLHRLIESMRRAYADRSRYLGDPDFVSVPVAELTAKDYAARLRAAIELERATPSSAVAPGLEVPAESPQTTHFSVWDRQGNVVSNTYTLNFSYGSGIAVAGAGFLLNNEMDDFSAQPGAPNAYGLLGGEANAIAPRKRPLSSMTPAILVRDGKPVLATGSPGGPVIITAVLQTILNVVDFGMNVAEATAQPRIHHQWQPDEVYYEAGISPDTLKLLQGMGHRLVPSPRVLGRTQTIASDGAFYYGSNDTRWPEGAAVAP
ncbi:MAG: gamma-glutamyltransferase [Porticoccaceae bacterium]